MSLFVPFATGFLNTYTDVKRDQAKAKIDKEKADEDRRYEFGKTVLEFVGEGKITGDATEIAAAFESQDYLQLANLVNSMQKIEDTTRIGMWSFPFDNSGETPGNIPELNMLNVDNLFANEETFQKYFQDAQNDPTGNTAKSYIKFIDSNFGQNKLNRFKTENKDQSVIISQNLYPNAYRMYNELNSNSPSQTREALVADEVSMVIDVSKEKRPDNSIYIRGNQTNNTASGAVFVSLDESEYQNIDFFAKSMGMSVDSFTANLPNYSYNKTNTEQQIIDLKYGSALLNAGIVNVLTNPTQNPQAVADIRRIYAQMENEVGEENLENTFMGAMYMVSNTMKSQNAEDQLDSLTSVTKSGAQILGSKRAADITARFDASENVVNLGTRLMNARQQLDKTGIAKQLLTGIIGVTDQFNQVTELAGWHSSQGNVVTDNTKGGPVTQESLESIYKKRRGGTGALLAEIDVLEFNLAVQIARSADPNGRLSNQDFDNALRTLGSGGFFTSRGGTIGALQTTIDIHTKKRDDLTFLNDIANTERVSPDQRRALKAYNLTNTVTKRLGLETEQSRMNTDNSGEVVSTMPNIDSLVTSGAYLDVTSDYDTPQGSQIFVGIGSDKDRYIVSQGNVTKLDTLPPLKQSSKPPVNSTASGSDASAAALKDDPDNPPPPEESVQNTLSVSDVAGLKKTPLPGGMVSFEGKSGKYTMGKDDNNKTIYTRVSD